MIVALQRRPKSFAPQLLQFLAISPGPLFLPLDWSALAENVIKHYQQKSSAICRLLGNAVSQSRIHQTKSIDSQDEHNLRIESACWDAAECWCWKICLQYLTTVYKRYMKQNPRLYHAVVRNVCYQIYIWQYLAMFTPKLTASAAFTASTRSISLASACSENAPAQWWIPFVLCKSGNHPMYRWCNRWWLICWGVHRLSLCGFQRFFQCLLFCLASWGSVLWQENTVDIRVSPEKGDSGHLHLWSGIPLWPFQSMSHDYIPQLIWSGILDTSKMDGHAIYDDYWIRQFHILRQSPAAEHWTSLNSRGESHSLDGTCWSWEAF